MELKKPFFVKFIQNKDRAYLVNIAEKRTMHINEEYISLFLSDTINIDEITDEEMVEQLIGLMRLGFLTETNEEANSYSQPKQVYASLNSIKQISECSELLEKLMGLFDLGSLLTIIVDDSLNEIQYESVFQDISYLVPIRLIAHNFDYLSDRLEPYIDRVGLIVKDTDSSINLMDLAFMGDRLYLIPGKFDIPHIEHVIELSRELKCSFDISYDDCSFSDEISRLPVHEIKSLYINIMKHLDMVGYPKYPDANYYHLPILNPGNSCEAHCGRLYINDKLDLYPCYKLENPKFRLGHLLTDSMEPKHYDQLGVSFGCTDCNELYFCKGVPLCQFQATKEQIKNYCSWRKWFISQRVWWWNPEMSLKEYIRQLEEQVSVG